MTTEINDGGSAFPQLEPRNPEYTLCNPGMSLRDWFAGQAPITFELAAAACGYRDMFEAMNTKSQRIAVFRALIEMRSEYADAMLAARVTA